MTFNILYEKARVSGGWAARRDHVVRVIRDRAPDLAGLQEASRCQAADLTALLPEYDVLPGPPSGGTPIVRRGAVLASGLAMVTCVATIVGWWRSGDGFTPAGLLWWVGIAVLGAASLPNVLLALSRFLHDDLADVGHHCAILVRRDRFRVAREGAFWISPTPERPESLLPGNYAPHHVHWVRAEPLRGGPAWTLYDVHLGHGPWTWRRVSDLLRARLDADWDGSPQVLLGDFNAGPRSTLVRRLLTSRDGSAAPALCDAWSEAEVRRGPEASFHWRREFRAWPGRIDHVFLRPQLRVTVAEIVAAPPGGPYGSDHDPLVVEVDAT